MMRAAGLVMILLGLVGLGTSMVDWQTIGVFQAEDQTSLDVNVFEKPSGEPIEDDEREAKAPDPGPTALETEVTAEVPAGDVDVAVVSRAALDDVRETLRAPETAPTNGVSESAPASVRVFERQNPTAEATPTLWAEISAGNEIVNEDSGHANFLVTLSEPAERSVVIIFSTVDLSATDEEDYKSQRGTVTFEPGVVSAEIRTPLVDDDIKEADEQFAIVLNGAPGIVSFKSRRVTTTIRDND